MNRKSFFKKALMALAAIAVGKIALPEVNHLPGYIIRNRSDGETTVAGNLEWNLEDARFSVVNFRPSENGRFAYYKTENVLGVDPFTKRYKK